MPLMEFANIYLYCSILSGESIHAVCKISMCNRNAFIILRKAGYQISLASAANGIRDYLSFQG